MHTTASSLVAITQYFWRIRTSLLYGNQQKFNIEAVNDYPPIRIRIVAADSIRDSIQTEISDSQVSSSDVLLLTCNNFMDIDLHFLNVFSINFWFVTYEVIKDTLLAVSGGRGVGNLCQMFGCWVSAVFELWFAMSLTDC